MSDTRSELKKLVPLYCDELNSLDLSLYENYEFSEDYLNKKEKLIKNQSRIYYPLIKTTGRRIASAVIAAAIMGTTTVAAYAPARNAVKNFFLRIFNDHSVVSVQYDSEDIGDHKSRIEKRYSITVPDGFVLDESESVSTDSHIRLCYYSEDRSKSIYFDQYTADSYFSYYDNERGNFKSSSDKFGNEFMLYINDDFINILWDNGEYIFSLSGDISESEIMDIYYSVK
ncbi:DUF4367 domain-containing protein [Ruminococcus bicirculans (ex Wegman et al. 2014)]|uniref:DUF4367 domain-containing protein n=1 Tax=Ruminococcus bicirculans (ex Wegman et al. 2014) TaxID=1160721 RepID=UPI00366B676D